MAKINEYPQAATINNNDLFVIDQQSGGDHATKSASVSQIESKVTAEVKEDIGNLSQLTTTVKSSLVGAVNEVNGKVNAIGTLVQGTKTATVFTRSWTAKGNIVLTKGVWVVSARVILAQDNSGYRAMNVASTSGDNTPQCITAGIYGNLTALNMSFIQNVTSSSTTLYLNGYHNSTDNSELNIVSFALYGVKVG